MRCEAERERLAAGAGAIGMALNDKQQTHLLSYLELLAKWNNVYNLTAIRDPHQMLVQHIFDSLVIVPYLARFTPSTVLDVGSGGGLPAQRRQTAARTDVSSGS